MGGIDETDIAVGRFRNRRESRVSSIAGREPGGGGRRIRTCAWDRNVTWVASILGRDRGIGIDTVRLPPQNH